MTEPKNDLIPQELEAFMQQHAAKWQETEQHSFFDLLMQFVCRSGKRNSEIANAAQVNKSTVTRLLSKQTVSAARDTVIAIAFALELSAEELTQLLKARDVHDCFPADRKDYVILYQITKGRYSLIELNRLLNAYGCTIIGSNSE